MTLEELELDPSSKRGATESNPDCCSLPPNHYFWMIGDDGVAHRAISGPNGEAIILPGQLERLSL